MALWRSSNIHYGQLTPDADAAKEGHQERARVLAESPGRDHAHSNYPQPAAIVLLQEGWDFATRSAVTAVMLPAPRKLPSSSARSGPPESSLHQQHANTTPHQHHTTSKPHRLHWRRAQLLPMDRGLLTADERLCFSFQCPLHPRATLA
eukprot:CAMPEP_0171080368 /NCGR_PEP_ID=MMETSP0766_2-20121228/15826_1 /TAXON_ID=439317 /ORGANISM="Gambierdiscus australes, Strain CAWD 149" /LENGTH=148 /DNA_ID=CAMNT_0011537603 /DNA_START=140 /DNA_END=583 /DNA_ORIENTATION=+